MREKLARDPVELPPLPKYNVKRTLACRHRLIQELHDYVGCRLDTKKWPEFVRSVGYVLGGRVPEDAIGKSLDSCRGLYLDERVLTENMSRLAGNLTLLSRGIPALPWQVQRGYEWALFQVTGGAPEHRHGKPGCLFTFKVLIGSPSPSAIQRWWSVKLCRYMSSQFGFSRPRSQKAHFAPPFPFSATEQLVTLRFYGLLDPALCLERNQPAFRDLAFPPAVQKWNREQLCYRFRQGSEYDCPEGNPRTLSCHRCPIGYLQCRAGTHRQNWIEKECPACRNPDAFFDPEIDSQVCVMCLRQGRSAHGGSNNAAGTVQPTRRTPLLPAPGSGS